MHHVSLQEKRHLKALRELERAEKRMVLAFTRWQKLRAKVRRYDATADKKRGGEYDQFASLAAGELIR